MADTSLDACLGLVADRRRRLVIELLRHEADGEASFDALLDRCWGVTAPDDGAIESREQFAAQLYHNHLPKLEAHGVVEHDTDERTVRYCPNTVVETVLDSLPVEPPVAGELSRRR